MPMVSWTEGQGRVGENELLNGLIYRLQISLLVYDGTTLVACTSRGSTHYLNGMLFVRVRIDESHSF